MSSYNAYCDAADEQDAQELTIFVAGDAIITQPWSHIDDERFLRLIAEIRNADVAIVNLELVLSDFNGFPQANSGGTHLAARSTIAKELEWAGIDMVATANNHSFDYGSIGVMETLEAVASAGLISAGTGLDLQSARRPGYLERQRARIALVAMTSTLIPYGIGGMSRPAMHGRPGLNPLRVSFDGKLIRVFTEVQRNILDILGRMHISLRGIEPRTIDRSDRLANLEALRLAESDAEVVVASIHAHNPGPWLEDFAHEAIDTGADIVFSHGSHSVAGIELYRGRPIFYGLGNFVFQIEQVEKLPAEQYEKYGLGSEATPQDFFKAARAHGHGYSERREAWEGLAAAATFEADRLKQVRLIPIDLNGGGGGTPRFADERRGKHIIENVAQWSQRFGTKVEYEQEEGVGSLAITRGR